MMKKTILAAAVLACLSVDGTAVAQVFTKAQVGDRIRKVEDGVDEFRKWTENRAEDRTEGRAEGANAPAAKGSGRSRGRTATESQKAAAGEKKEDKKDELDDALGELNQSTNRLRRRFDPGDNWMETRPQVENVMDDARKINQVLVRGKYGSQAERYWGVLRTAINDLARCYNLTPLAR